MKNYNARPKSLGQFNIESSEYFSYTYLPIKMKGSDKIVNEPRLSIFDPIIGRACCDFIGEYGLDRFMNSYVYLIAKNAMQRDIGFNRPGWHSDGFMTDDVSYIWSNAQPTIFNDGDFFLSQDDLKSMKEMDEMADETKNFSEPNNTLIRMDQFTIHKVGPYIKGERMFAKIVISEDIYALRGNSINHALDYKWDYIARKEHRNIPQATK
jgi:hypothetical protein